MPNPITSKMIYEITTISSPALSPDGTNAAYVASNINKETMQSESHIKLLDLKSQTSVAYTAGNKDSAPNFSPDGNFLAFFRPDSDGRIQIWTMATGGGEATQLTCVPDGVTEMSWAPNSKKVAFISDVDPDRLPANHDHKKEPRVRIAHRITYRADGLGWRGSSRRHLFVIDVQESTVLQLTSGDWDDASPRWSPDGLNIAFISARKCENDISRSVMYYIQM